MNFRVYLLYLHTKLICIIVTLKVISMLVLPLILVVSSSILEAFCFFSELKITYILNETMLQI